jgi:hypothetical protein
MNRDNHYEAAFEAYLQWHRLCYVAVDETRRCMLGETRVKSLDFIVHGDAGSRLVCVPGRSSIQRIFELTGVDTVLEWVDNPDSLG